MDVESTWTDELNAVLQPFGILLSGVDAASIFPALGRGSPLEILRSVTDADIAEIAKVANLYCETDCIETGHIRHAIERTKLHWNVR